MFILDGQAKIGFILVKEGNTRLRLRLRRGRRGKNRTIGQA